MLKSISKGLEKNWKAAANGISKAADKGFEKVAHGTFDRSDSWSATYPDEGETYVSFSKSDLTSPSYELTLRRDKTARRKDEPPSTGRFKFRLVQQQTQTRHEAQGRIAYLPDELLLTAEVWTVSENFGTSQQIDKRFESREHLGEPQIGNGCYEVPANFLGTSACFLFSSDDVRDALQRPRGSISTNFYINHGTSNNWHKLTR